MTGHAWELLPHLLLRSTGFPFGWLERLAFTETAVQLERLLDCEDALAALQIELEAALQADADPATGRLRRQLWDRVHRSRLTRLAEADQQQFPATLGALLMRWDALLDERTTLDQQARTTFAAELPERRRALFEIASDARFQEAVWLSSPQMFQHGLRPYLERWKPEQRPSEMRRIERQLVAYLQRFCAKNDTAGFFGPLNYGNFHDQPQPAAGLPGAAHVQRREAFAAYWGVAALAEAISADEAVQAFLRPQRSPLCQLDQDAQELIIAGQLRRRLPQRLIQLLAALDGTRTTAELATLNQRALPELLVDLQTLVRLRAVLLGPNVPITVLHPLEWLINWVNRLPPACATRERWRDVLADISTIQSCFADAPLADKQALLTQLETIISDLTQQAARRGQGELYADRLLIYEESLGGLSPLALGPRCAAEIQRQLAPALDLYAAHACHSQTQLRAAGATLLAEHAPDGRMPWLAFINALRDHSMPELADSPWQQAVLEQIRAQPDAPTLALDPSELPPINRERLAAEVLLTSPDVMLLARDLATVEAGDFQLVIGECHDTLMLWGWALYFHPWRERVEADTAALLERTRGQQVLANVLPSKRVKIVPFEYPGPTIEMLVPGVRPGGERIAGVEVQAQLVDGVPVLQAPGWPSVQLYNGELPTLAHSLFAPPRVVPPSFDGGQHTPRLTFGKVVLQRERWHVDRATLFPRRYQGASFDLLYDVWAAARRLGLPRHIFVRVAGERKPIYVDQSNYFLLEFLDYLLPAESSCQISEMLPAPDQLWLRDGDAAFCAELRISACYAIGDDPA